MQDAAQRGGAITLAVLSDETLNHLPVPGKSTPPPPPPPPPATDSPLGQHEISSGIFAARSPLHDGGEEGAEVTQAQGPAHLSRDSNDTVAHAKNSQPLLSHAAGSHGSRSSSGGALNDGVMSRVGNNLQESHPSSGLMPSLPTQVTETRTQLLAEGSREGVEGTATVEEMAVSEANSEEGGLGRRGGGVRHSVQLHRSIR